MELLGTPKVRLGVPAYRFPMERRVEALIFSKQNQVRNTHFLLERRSQRSVSYQDQIKKDQTKTTQITMERRHQ